jgi:hypothetical protein
MELTPCDIFIQNYIREDGTSDLIMIDELVRLYGDRFKSNNGCQWARKGSKLDNYYQLKRFNAKELGIKGVAWNRIVAIQTFGHRENREYHNIPTGVYTELKNKPCAVLGVITTDMEIDHKNGKYDTLGETISDFQPLTKAVNDAKREHCKRCNATGCRFKASVLGYAKDFTQGDEHSPTCKGCYWNDIYAFNHIISGGI